MKFEIPENAETYEIELVNIRHAADEMDLQVYFVTNSVASPEASPQGARSRKR